MENPHLLTRLEGIQTILNGVRKGGKPLSSASQGYERQKFVDEFLSQVLPTPYRFGNGDITDVAGRQSGQCDVVVEFPLMPSLPLPGNKGPRLYLAESVAAVLEIKSNVAAEWDKVLDRARQLSQISRGRQGIIDRTFGAYRYTKKVAPHIPLYAVGYTGWKKLETVKKKLADGPIRGILVIDSGVFLTRGGMKYTGAWALWGLIAALTILTNSNQIAMPDPQIYANP